MIPMQKQTTDTTAELTVTEQNVVHTRMEVRAGKMIRLEISKVPIIRMPSTMVSAVKMASRASYL